MVALLLLRRLVRRRGGSGDAARQLFRYRVPTGQDPAAVLGRLHVAGIPAEPHVSEGESVLTISVPTSTSPESVRDIIRDAPENMQGDPGRTDAVTFVEEA